MENFTRYTAGMESHTDLVDDGWTRVASEVTKTAIQQENERRGAPMSPEEIGEFLFEADYRSMERVRARIDSVVTDTATAERSSPGTSGSASASGSTTNTCPRSTATTSSSSTPTDAESSG